MRSDLSGKVSLVTGAARGIGQAIADRLATNGSKVVYTDVDVDGAKLAASRQSGALGLGLDVTNSEQIAEVVERVRPRSGARSTSSSTTPGSTAWPTA